MLLLAMRKFFPFLLLFHFSLISCHPNKENNNSEEETIINFTIDDIPSPTKLTGSKLNFKEFLNPRHILFLDNYLIIAQNTDQALDLYYVYNLKNKSFVGNIGKKGFGPGEMIQSTGLEPEFSKGEFFSFDGNRRTLNFYNIHGADTTNLAQKQFKGPASLNFVTEMSLTSPNSYVVKNTHSWDKLVEITLEGDTLKTYGTWNKMLDNKDTPPFAVSHICQGDLVVSSDRTYIGISGVLKDFIEIFNRNTGKRLYIQGPVNQEPTFRLRHHKGITYPLFDNSTTMHYTQLHLLKDSFLVLYSGLKSGNDDLPQLFQFDYEGNFIHNFQLDYPILSFSVDEKKGILYGITLDQDPNVVVYDLRKHLYL